MTFIINFSYAVIVQVPGNFHVSTHSAQRQPEKPDMTHILHKVRFGMEMQAGKVTRTDQPLNGNGRRITNIFISDFITIN